MKNRNTKIIIPFILLITLIFFSFTKDLNEDYMNTSAIIPLEIPAEVKAVLDNKCMGCHSNDAKGGKSKMKMNFDKFTNGEYSTGKTISKLGKITKQLDKGKMPPKKYLDKYPDKKLTEEENQLLLNWASEQGAILKEE